MTGGKMRKVILATLFVVTLLTALSTLAQNPNYDNGPIWRVVYYHIKPGRSEPLWKDFREHVKPTYDAIKKEGILSDYKVWTNVTTDHPQDWDVAVGLMFPNWAALDQSDARTATIAAKRGIPREAMIEAGEKTQRSARSDSQ